MFSNATYCLCSPVGSKGVVSADRQQSSVMLPQRKWAKTKEWPLQIISAQEIMLCRGVRRAAMQWRNWQRTLEPGWLSGLRWRVHFTLATCSQLWKGCRRLLQMQISLYQEFLSYQMLMPSRTPIRKPSNKSCHCRFVGSHQRSVVLLCWELHSFRVLENDKGRCRYDVKWWFWECGSESCLLQLHSHLALQELAMHTGGLHFGIKVEIVVGMSESWVCWSLMFCSWIDLYNRMGDTKGQN